MWMIFFEAHVLQEHFHSFITVINMTFILVHIFLMSTLLIFRDCDQTNLFTAFMYCSLLIQPLLNLYHKHLKFLSILIQSSDSHTPTLRPASRHSPPVGRSAPPWRTGSVSQATTGRCDNLARGVPAHHLAPFRPLFLSDTTQTAGARGWGKEVAYQSCNSEMFPSLCI